MLTGRQLEILERIVQRKPYKVIAGELDISETRVKQHVRSIKDRLGANSMAELVARFHAIADGPPYTIGEGPKMEVPHRPHDAAETMADDPGALAMADLVTMELAAPWIPATEPRIVPGVLDGESAALSRLLAILGIVIALLAAIVLALSVATALSEQFRDTGLAPMEKSS